jgi:hypothetical protein
MAHLWKPEADQSWVATVLLDDQRLVDDGSDAVLMRRLADTPNGWAILTRDPASVRVNGAPLSLGIAMLADRDEIRTADRTLWFSTETRPAVEPFPESTPRGSCPRCKTAIEPASRAVRCPSCGLWHHASDELPCWSYGATCAICTQPTALDAPCRWSPEDL